MARTNYQVNPMLRPVTPADTPALVALSASSGLFRPEELDAVGGMFDHYHAAAADGHRILAWEEGPALIGMVYFAPREFADRVWELLMIAVDAGRHRQGVGSRMLAEVEAAVREANGRLLLIETSDKASFERTRLFYRKHGYAEVARIPDYYFDGDGKASFLKRLAERA